MKKNITDEAAFFGKINAGISHDINNILAIIRESSGLLTDLMEFSPPENIFVVASAI